MQRQFLLGFRDRHFGFGADPVAGVGSCSDQLIVTAPVTRVLVVGLYLTLNATV
jgi:hypothetical protein